MNVQKARNLSNVLREIYREIDPPGRTYRPTLSAHPYGRRCPAASSSRRSAGAACRPQRSTT